MTRPDETRRHRLIAQAVLVSCALLIAAGCQAPAPTESPPPPTPEPMPAPPAGAEVIIPAELNTPRAAGMYVATLPPVADARTRVEIALHQALYRAAWESNVGAFTDHYLLEPPRRAEGDPDQPGLSIDAREFRLRVLAALGDLRVPLAFAGTQPIGPPDHFPGVRAPVTRLQIRILSRDPAQATVIAEVGDTTLHGSSSRQRVTAVWDGAEWILERDPVRLVW